MRICIRSAIWHRLGVASICAAVALLAGCIIIPVDYYAAGSRRNVSLKSQGQLRLGETTKEDLFLLFGEPDFASEDGMRFGYAWTKVKVIWAVASTTSSVGGEVQRSYVLEASFDASNRLSQLRLLKAWGSTAPPDRDPEKPHDR